MKVRSGLRSVSLAARLALLGCLLLTASQASQAQGLVSWWPGNGNYNDVVSGNDGTPFGGVLFLSADYGEGFFFNGFTARIHVPDVPSLAITGSMAITAWVWVASYPTPPNGNGQILFRGDDRANSLSGLDPYSLTVSNPHGNLFFEVTNAAGYEASVIAPKPIALGKFVFVAATLDDASGLMSLYENGVMVDHTSTTIRPYADLDPTRNPGLGIGSYQDTVAPSYFEGIIDDLKIYNTDDPQITPIKLSLNHSTVKGGSTVTATLTLNDSPIVPAHASVSSAVAAATVPAKVTVTAGRYSASFVIKTQAVTTSQSGNIAVVLNGITLTASLMVTP